MTFVAIGTLRAKIPSSPFHDLTLCLLGNFSCFSSSNFFQNQLFRKILQEYHERVKHFGSRSGPTFNIEKVLDSLKVSFTYLYHSNFCGG